MAGSYLQRPRSSKPFVVTAYVVDAHGWLGPEIPACCPARDGPDSATCRLGIDHYRRRQRGPGHLLTVLRCRTHARAFTLYPPGYAPYRRQPVMNIAPDGKTVYGEGDREQTQFGATVFQAALDAKEGRRWARQSDPYGDPPQRWWGTQGRHLAFAARLVGVAQDLTDTVRHTIAAVLSVPTLQLRVGSGASGYRGVGQAICAVLAQLRASARQALQLLICGHLGGCWGEPLYWDCERHRLERSPFLRHKERAEG